MRWVLIVVVLLGSALTLLGVLGWRLFRDIAQLGRVFIQAEQRLVSALKDLEVAVDAQSSQVQEDARSSREV